MKKGTFCRSPKKRVSLGAVSKPPRPRANGAGFETAPYCQQVIGSASHKSAPRVHGAASRSHHLAMDLFNELAKIPDFVSQTFHRLQYFVDGGAGVVAADSPIPRVERVAIFMRSRCRGNFCHRWLRSSIGNTNVLTRFANGFRRARISRYAGRRPRIDSPGRRWDWLGRYISAGSWRTPLVPGGRPPGPVAHAGAGSPRRSRRGPRGTLAARGIPGPR